MSVEFGMTVLQRFCGAEKRPLPLGAGAGNQGQLATRAA